MNISLPQKQRKSGEFLNGVYKPGVAKFSRMWLIPKDAEKPIDGRTKHGKELHHE